MPVDVTVTKGPGGYGMNISEHGIVTSFSGDDSAAKLAGVPVKSRIVRQPVPERFPSISRTGRGVRVISHRLLSCCLQIAVQGHPVENKHEVVQQLKQLGAVQQVTFTVEPAESTTPSAASAPAAAGGQVVATRMVVPFFAAMEGTSQHAGVLQKGQSVRVFQTVVDSKGKTKVQHEHGWTPLKSPAGELVFDNLGDPSAGQLGSVPAAPAPMPSGSATAAATDVAAGAATAAVPEDPQVALVADAIREFNGRAKHGVRQMLDNGLACIDSLRERGVVDEAELAKFASHRGAPMEDSSPPAVVRLLRRPWGKHWDLRPSASGSGEQCYVHTSSQDERPCLSKQEIGEYLGEPDDFNKAVMAEWLRMDCYSGLGFDDALRMFLAGFKLPGEAQKIDRFMEAFSAEYFRANPGVFNEQDTAYTLAFSVIMLNTDHFNPRCASILLKFKIRMERWRAWGAPMQASALFLLLQAAESLRVWMCCGCIVGVDEHDDTHSIREDRKMTREQFIGNNRAIDIVLTSQYLGAIFDCICSNEIKMDSIDTDDQSSIICYTNPTKHGYLEKKGPGGLGKGAYKKRWFVLKNKLLYYLEEPPALGKRPALRGFIPIVRSGPLY